jgi:hypothetical protein
LLPAYRDGEASAAAAWVDDSVQAVRQQPGYHGTDDHSRCIKRALLAA